MVTKHNVMFKSTYDLPKKKVQDAHSHVESSLPYSLNKMGMSSMRNCNTSGIKIVLNDKLGEDDKRRGYCMKNKFSIDGRLVDDSLWWITGSYALVCIPAKSFSDGKNAELPFHEKLAMDFLCTCCSEKSKS